MAYDRRSVVEVFTNKSKEFMLNYGGSASWVVSVPRAMDLAFCVCCRNDERPREDDRGARLERRNEAFFVGKVCGIEFVERQNNRDRYLIKFSEYAEVSVADFRQGSTRNPVLYSNVDECRLRGLDIEALEFKPMPIPTKSYQRRSDTDGGQESLTERRSLSIAEAKEGLALHFKVPVEAIQITISA